MDKELDSLNSCTADEEVKKEIEELMQNVGIYCRIFVRIKKADSLKCKLHAKKDKYVSGRKLQDLIGVRIALYFEDDREICTNIINNKYEIYWNDSQIDNLGDENFKAVRYNLICSMPERIVSMFDDKIWSSYPIDKTIEVQIRTVFSEGWHEVEHDIRYKNKEKWKTDEYKDFSRFLNSIFATLEMCDASIIHLMDRMAYNAYNKRDVADMLRYKFRIRFSKDMISEELLNIFRDNHELLKSFFRLERGEVLRVVSNQNFNRVPKTMDNLVYLCNELWIKDNDIKNITPQFLTSIAENIEEIN